MSMKKEKIIHKYDSALGHLRFKRAEFIPEELPWLEDPGFQIQANVAFDVFHQAFNALLLSASRGWPYDCLIDATSFDAPQWFPESKLYIDAAFDEFERQEATPSGARQMWRTRQKVMPALGNLKAMIIDRLPELTFPDRPAGIQRQEVDYVMLRRGRAGWVPEIHILAPFGLVPLLAQLQGRSRYVDIGLAVTPHGIALSILSPRGAIEVIRGRAIHLNDFRYNLAPAFVSVDPSQMDLVSPEAIALRIWDLILRQRLHVRAFVLDQSLQPRLSSGNRRMWKRIATKLRLKCEEAGITFGIAPTIQKGHRERSAFLLAGTPDGETGLADTVLSKDSLECPSCGGIVVIEKSPRSGIPFAVEEVHCESCHEPFSVGALLADRARSFGAESFIPLGPYDLN